MQQHKGVHFQHCYSPIWWLLLVFALFCSFVSSFNTARAQDSATPMVVDVQPILDITIDRLVLPIKTDETEAVPQSPYGYRHITQKRQINLLLYGVEDMPDGKQPAASQPKKAPLAQMMADQWSQLKARSAAKKGQAGWQMQWGGSTFLPQTAFEQTEDNLQGQSIKPPKFVGATTQKGRWSYGMGYTWDEENKAYMVDERQGWLVGTGYQGNKNLWQATYLHTSDGGFSLPGGSNSGDQITLQLQRQVAGRPITANVQYLHNQKMQEILLDDTAMITVGTQWKF